MANEEYEKIKLGLRNARTYVNDGYNKRGCYLPGDRCKAIVDWIDDAMLYLSMHKNELQGKKEDCEIDHLQD